MPPVRGRGLIAGVTTAALLAVSAPASGDPIALGTGSLPGIAVDSNGTAHVSWAPPPNAPTSELRYCPVPRGADGCVGGKTLPLPFQDYASTYVFAPGDGRVILVAVRCCTEERVYAIQSLDGGKSFGSPVEIGSVSTFASYSDLAFGPGNTISGTGPSKYQQMPVSGPKQTSYAQFNPPFENSLHASTAVFDGTTPVYAESGPDTSVFYYYSGSGDPNAAASWIGPKPMKYGGDPELAGGPLGLVLLQVEDPAGSAPPKLVARKFAGDSFGKGVAVGSVSFPSLQEIQAEPITGGFHAVWQEAASAPQPAKLKWSRSPQGLDWGVPVTVLSGAEASATFNLRLAAAPNGDAAMAWDQNSQYGKVFITELGGSGGPVPASDLIESGGYEYSLFAPFACVAKPAPARLRASSRSIRKLAADKRVKVVKVAFSLGTSKRSDRTRGFTASFPTESLDAGRYPATATVTIERLRDGKRSTKRLVGTAAVCD